MSDRYQRAGRIRRALADIKTHYPSTLAPVRRASGSHATAAAFAPLPVSAHILDARAMACSRLAGWALVVIEERNLHPRLYGTDVVGLVKFLDAHADWLAIHEASADVIAELEASATELGGIAAPRHAETMYLGRCPIVTEGVTCGGKVRAVDAENAYCTTCRVEAVVSWWATAMGCEANTLLTGPRVVAMIHAQYGRRIGEATVRQWVSRGVLISAGQDERGRNLYDRSDVAEAMRGQQ